MPRDVPPLFHRVAAEFAELLSVVLERPITWVYDLPGSISQTAALLLGQYRYTGSKKAGEFVGNFHDPFRKRGSAPSELIQSAVDIFARKSVSNYAVQAPVLHRLSNAHRTFGRFAKEDRILDLAIIFERCFPDEQTYKTKLGLKISETLGKSHAERVQIRADIEHFYDIRSAIVHGGKKEGDTERLREIDQALSNGFKYARALLLKLVE